MNTIKSKIPFNKAGYYFIGLVVIALLGFWKSYFHLFIYGPNNSGFYIHFHATMVSLWITLLIVQPILIRKKKFAAHRFIGKLSYLVMPLLIISVILLRNSIFKQTSSADAPYKFFSPTYRDLFILATAFIIAIWKRNKVQIHARAMIATVFGLLQAPIDRIEGNFLPGQGIGIRDLLGVRLADLVIFFLFVTLIFIERKQKSGRWVFPLIFGIWLTFFSLYKLRTEVPFLDAAVNWMATAPLTYSPAVKDLLIPPNEIERYAGEYESAGEQDVVYKKENQLWERWKEPGNKFDSTRLLYQGDNIFISDKYRSNRYYFQLKEGKAETFSIYNYGKFDSQYKRKS